MAKTLRVLSKAGWITKPVDDIPANRLTASEIDSNFLELEREIENQNGFVVNGTLTPVAQVVDIPKVETDNAALGTPLNAQAQAIADRFEYLAGDDGASMVGIGGGRTQAGKNNEIVSILDYGADPTGTVDSYAAIASAVAAHKSIRVPNGTYLTSQTINWGDCSVYGSNSLWNNKATGTASIIRAMTDDMLVCKGGYYIENLVIDGNFKALWGCFLPSHCNGLDVVRCKEYGPIANASQNGSYVNLRGWKNKHNLVLANGARNNNFFNFRASIEEGGVSGGPCPTDSSLILFLIDTSNPHGFGLYAGVTSGGNDRNNFFGGISESVGVGAVPDFGIRTANNSAYGGTVARNNNFFGYEIDAKGIIYADSTFAGAFSFYDCLLNIASATDSFSSGTKARVNFYGSTRIGSGTSVALRGITFSSNFLQTIYANSNELVEAILNQQYISGTYGIDGGSASFTFDGTLKQFSVSGASAAHQGLSVVPCGPLCLGNTGIAGLSLRSAQPIVKITFSVDEVIGGSGTVTLYHLLNASPFRASVASYGVGIHEVYFKCTSQTAGFSFGQNSSTSYKISNIKIESI